MVEPRDVETAAAPAAPTIEESKRDRSRTRVRPDPAQLVPGGHCGRSIENECHYVLDVTFGEDANRTADRNAAANLGVVRRAAIGMLKRDEAKISKPRKAFRAALNTKYLEKLLRGNAVI